MNMNRDFKNKDDLCAHIKNHEKFSSIYLDINHLPKPYHSEIENVKAIVLGADPSNPQGNIFEYVFGINSRDKRYFSQIESNLKRIGLTRCEVYVQNLCRNYFINVTSNNPYWHDIAQLWIPLLKSELDGLFNKKLPVLLTTKFLYYVLTDIAEDMNIRFKTFYEKSEYISPLENKLKRKIIFLFRHPTYNLKNWPSYSESIRKEIS